MKNFKKKTLISAISIATLSTISTVSHTSDVDIYQAAQQGAPSILLMLDTSGSMGISSLVLPKDNAYGSPGDVTASICKLELVQEGATGNAMLMPEWQYDAVDYRTNVTVNGVANQRSPTYGKTSFYNEVKIGDTYVPYYMRGCTINDNVSASVHDATNIQFDRLSKLKEAILTLMASNEIQDTVKMGLANFSARTDVNIFDFGLKLVDGHSGAILQPVAPLTPTQRQQIAQKLAEFKSLDTTTNEKGEKVDKTVGNYVISQLSLTNNQFSSDVLDYKRVSSGTPTAHAYAEAAAYMMGTHTGKRNTWNYWANNIKTVQYVYDGYAIMRHNAKGVSESEKQGYQDKTVYLLCVDAARNSDGTLYNGGTYAWGDSKKYSRRVTQCVNDWQGYKPDANRSRIQIKSSAKVASYFENVATRNKQLERKANAFPGVTVTWHQATENPYNEGNVTAYFAYNTVNNQLVGTIGTVRIDGHFYEYYIDYRVHSSTNSARPIARIESNGQSYYAYQTTDSWQGKRDDDILLYPNTVQNGQSLGVGSAVGRFQQGFPDYAGRTIQRTTDYYFTGIPITMPDGSTRIHFGKNSDATKRYAKREDALWQVWKAYVDMPEGARMGGWMRLEHEPMDIEPIVGANHFNGETGAIGLFVYRANPFSLSGGDAGTKGVSSLTADDMVGGMAYSNPSTMNADKSQYIRGGSINACDGNGIYFLTDGAPNSTQDEMARTIMNHSLGSQHSIASKPTGGLVSPILKSGLFAGETGGWEYIGEYAKRLNNPNQNPARMTIKTAVVGFGSSFESASSGQCDSVVNPDAKNACLWGSEQYGKGGFYYANNSEDIKNSIKRFVADVNTVIEPVSTGSPSIPTNTFNPTEAPREAYYGSFLPKPNDATQIWLGDMNKYRLNANRDLVGTNGVSLFKTDGSLNALATGLWEKGSVLAQLPLQKNSSEPTQFARTIYTDRKISGNKAENSSSLDLQKVDTSALYNGALSNDPYKNYWLNILGYDLDVNGATPSFEDLSATVLRQLGAVMHSTPQLLTQEGKLEVVREVANGVYTGKRIIQSSGRKDFLMFGSTQGLLHVIDANTGKEKFSFVPNEMMRVQKEALINENKSTGGINRLFYGIDAPWTVYSQYVLKTDSGSSDTNSLNVDVSNLTNASSTGNNTTLTVNNAGNRFTDSDPTSLSGAGVQWVYGGLRMGGRSYYALDLTDVDNPKLRFHIDPENGAVHANGKTTSYDALRYMGQSWSKPTITRVKWRDKTKLVMFVGGGYDAGGTAGNGEFDSNGVRTAYKGYEDPAYNQDNKRGAGIYMFDAISGDLLWWGGANVDSTTASSADPHLAKTKDDDLQYSVVSQINAIDRDNDGLADHLYFGDLAGQAFRIDINNTVKNSGGFVKRIERLFTEHQIGGSSPRFYSMPSVSAYNYNGKIRVVAVFNSGNMSSPLVGTNVTTSNQTVTTTSAVDAVYTVYDYNVARSDLYTVSDETYSRWAKPETWYPLDQVGGVAFNSTTTRGWKYVYNALAGQIKGTGNISTLGYFLYTNGYNKDGRTTETQVNKCNATVLGTTTTYRFCMPTGKCEIDLHKYTTTSNDPTTGSNKSGLNGTGFGGSTDPNASGSVVGITDSNGGGIDCTLEVNKSNINCSTVDLSGSVKQLRWYETN